MLKLLTLTFNNRNRLAFILMFSAIITVFLGVSADCTRAYAATVSSVSTNDNSFHVFAPDRPFSFMLTYAGEGVTGYQWVDWQGHSLGPVVSTSGLSFIVSSPTGVAVHTGYYGLRLLPNGTYIDPGHRKELGFAVLPKHEKGTPAALPFAMNHGGADDPYLRLSGTKTTWSVPWWTWNKNKPLDGVLNVSGWQANQQNVLKTGRIDLPLMVSDPWGVDPPNLPAIAKMADAFFMATPNVPAWEWGREEAHVSWDTNTAQAYYRTLAEKYQVVRAEANKNGAARTLLVHQLEGVYETNPTKMDAVQVFFQSDALKYVDVLSLHPYPWPDFRSPDTWLDSFLLSVNKYRAASAKPNIPIWITEVGCPTDDAGLGPNNMQDGGSPITALSREDAAIFMIKTHIIAFSDGVKRIYWYHYADWDTSTTNAESHFGLKDAWGYVSPEYASYANLANSIGLKTFKARTDLPGNVRSYKFSDSKAVCYIVWATSPPAKPLAVSVRSITGGSGAVVNIVGTPIATPGGNVEVSAAPVFITAAAPR